MTLAEPQSLTHAQFAKLAAIIHDETGIVLSEAKKGLLVARLSKRLRALKIADFAGYCAHLNGPAGEAERRHLLSAITTNVTSFFREAHHFEALGRHIAQGLADPARRGQRLRLWSSACSSGPEAYSIAMTLLECCPEISQRDSLILASDIDPQMVSLAESGLYSAEELAGLSPARLQRFFTPKGDGFQIKPEVKALLRFGELNLHDPWPFSGRFDAIFCRNVVIYFDAAHRQRLWQRFAEVLLPGAMLFIGHSERLEGAAAEKFLLRGATQYERRPE